MYVCMCVCVCMCVTINVRIRSSSFSRRRGRSTSSSRRRSSSGSISKVPVAPEQHKWQATKRFLIFDQQGKDNNLSKARLADQNSVLYWICSIMEPFLHQHAAAPPIRFAMVLSHELFCYSPGKMTCNMMMSMKGVKSLSAPGNAFVQFLELSGYTVAQRFSLNAGFFSQRSR